MRLAVFGLCKTINQVKKMQPVASGEAFFWPKQQF
jgi:hypothetical protein